MIGGPPDHVQGVGVPGGELKEGYPQGNREPAVAHADELLVASVHLDIGELAHLPLEYPEAPDEEPGEGRDDDHGGEIGGHPPAEGRHHIAYEREVEEVGEGSDHPLPYWGGVQEGGESLR